MLKAGVAQRARVTRHAYRPVPNEYAEAVEFWARGHGGHATIRWYGPPMNCWAVVLSLRPGDPRAQSEAPEEPVFLHDWKEADWWRKHAPDRAKRNVRDNRIMPASYAYELDELGVQGIIERLDRGNLLSGRGEFNSAEEAGLQQLERGRRAADKRRLSKRDDAVHHALERRRFHLKIPFLPVGIEFDRDGKAKEHRG